MIRGIELIVLALLLLLMGGVFGWSARAVTADHRYIQALAARHEAEADYYLAQYDETIHSTNGNILKGRQQNGQKKN